MQIASVLKLFPSKTGDTPRPVLILALTVLLYISMGMAAPAILSLDNLRNIFVQTSYLALFASAQAIVILTRGLDLSLGTTVSLASVTAAIVMTSLPGGGPMVAVVGLAAGIAVGVAVGMANGVGVAMLGVNPFIMTLGMLNILLSFATTISGGYPVPGLPDAFLQLANLKVFGIPIQIIIVAVILGTLQWTLRKSVFGRSLYMIGANPAAARVAGIPVKRHLCAAYVICSVLAAVGALLLTARTGSGEPNLGGDVTLSAIAAAVLGGTRLTGGEGSIVAPVLGALLVVVLTNGLNLLQVNGFVQQVIIGLAIILAISIDRRRT